MDRIEQARPNGTNDIHTEVGFLKLQTSQHQSAIELISKTLDKVSGKLAELVDIHAQEVADNRAFREYQMAAHRFTDEKIKKNSDDIQRMYNLFHEMEKSKAEIDKKTESYNDAVKTVKEHEKILPGLIICKRIVFGGCAIVLVATFSGIIATVIK